MVREPSTILVVDDSDFARRMIGHRLREEGYRVREAADGSAALGKIAAGGCDLVLLDMNMPGLSGSEVLRSLRQSYSRSDLPVIVVTSNKTSAETVEAFDLGANDYVTKPPDFPQLMARVRNQLSWRSPEDAPFSQIEGGALIGGTYRLGARLGEGQFGAVYRATHLKLQREVAIKFLRADFQHDSEAKARFEIEGVSACRIEHPNAVTVLDFNVTRAGVPYLVMELLEGHSLAAEMRAQGQLSLARSVEILTPVCEVLSEAHALAIVHRDVKPQNIFLHWSRQGEVVKVLDFGIAKMLGDAADREVTVDDATPGTPIYMAPERISDEPYDGRSDVYSVAVTLYAMLTGQPPFLSKNPMRLAMMHLCDEPPRPRNLRPELPQAVEDVILRGLAKNPEDRPTAAELAHDFAAAAAGAG